MPVRKFLPILALVAWTDSGGIFAVYALTALTATASAFDGPERTSLMRTVDRLGGTGKRALCGAGVAVSADSGLV